MNSNHGDKFLLSFADILSLFQHGKKKILNWALIFGMIGIVFALLKPIRYKAEASFREKGVKSHNYTTSSVLQILTGGNIVGGESEASFLMTSSKILKDATEQLHLQAKLEALSDIETISKLMKKNFSLAWASLFSHSPEPVLNDLHCPLKLKTLHYEGEIPLSFLVDLEEDGQFELRDLHNGKQTVGRGRLGESFQFKELTFQLISSCQQQEVTPQTFHFSVNSLPNTIQDIRSVLKVETSKLEKSLLTLHFKHRDRFLSSQVLNAIMESYQSYLKNYHNNMATTQLDYLGQRRDQLSKNLFLLMNKHADSLSHDLSNTGFVETQKEIEFLAENQNEFKKKLLDNELAMNHLMNIKPGNLAFYDSHMTKERDSTIINSILTEIRNLKQSRDSLEIELHKKSIDHGVDLQSSFERQLKELKEIQDYLVEIKIIAEHYLNGILPDLNSKLINDSRFLLKGWFEKLQKEKKDSQLSDDNLKFYLNNLERLFSVHERILKERLTHHQNPSNEYQGISYELATNLYLDYCKQLIQMEATVRQNLFFIKQIEDPNFEITSLSAGLTDSVSHAMIQKASTLVLNLRDQNNQSVREQERIKEELQLQKTFLTMHLKQMVQLMELNKQLINEKIFSLQNVSLEMIHQRVSLLEKNLQDYLTSRLLDLQIEKSLIKSHLDSIHKEMSLLPQKWVSEKIVKQEVDTNQKIVEEIVKLVESKNISHKLELIQSAPIDIAIPPLHPISPGVMLWGLVGMLFGGFLGSSSIIGKTLKNGFQVTPQNLELMGFHFSGYYSENDLKKTNYDTLRRLLTYFENRVIPSRQEARVLLLLEGDGSQYASTLADLLLVKEKKIVILYLNSSESKLPSSAGLIQYLNGEVSEVPIQKGSHGDWMAKGGSDSYFIEKIGSQSFRQLMDKLKERYDWIVIVSDAQPCSIEAESLLSLFPNVAVTLKDEKIDQLKFYSFLLEQRYAHQLTFLLSI